MAFRDIPIAICGMGCRLPGEIKSPTQFWDLLLSERSAQSKTPENRFNIDKWHHSNRKHKGTTVAEGGYFLDHNEGWRNFDPAFFDIHPLEAASMDPQQRKLLEVVYETFESAGVTLDQVSGSQTACYVGAFSNDFAKTLHREPEQYFPYQSTGSDMTILSNRVNYVFNMKGPSLTVDTACSSSLYALHLACQGLLLNEFDSAIVAGTNIMMDFHYQIVASKLGILSPRSTCNTFDAKADGFGRAEGITALYIKRLPDAIAEGLPIRAVIRSSAINTNGRGMGLSQPAVSGQEEVIRKAYEKAGLQRSKTTYIECHGTGTPVGDPIEVAAIGKFFAPGRSPKTPILLSAVKSQIGHTEGASGIAAIQKVVMSLENGIVPATIGITNVNPSLDLKNGRVAVVQSAMEWPSGYRRAGVNSFGYGGANAHVVIDSFDSYKEALNKKICQNWISLDKSKADNSTIQLLVTSAHDSDTLHGNVSEINKLIPRNSSVDIALTLSMHRTHFRERAFLVTDRISEGLVPSQTWTEGIPVEGAATAAFIFTGQGAQWPRMGIGLVERFPVVRKTFEDLNRSLEALPEAPSWTLYDALAATRGESLMMTDVTVSVTLCTAIQVCIVDLLKHWGIRPHSVLGHSSGEAAASYCAGLLTASEAVITSYYRALAAKRNHKPGGMMAVGLGSKEVTQYLSDTSDIFLACHNSPQSTTLSGDMSSLDALQKVFAGENIFARIINTSGHANHSPYMNRAAEYFCTHFSSALTDGDTDGDTEFNIKMYSSITGGRITSTRLGMDYWANNMTSPVLFVEALEKMLVTEKNINCLIEIGPHSALSGPVRQTITSLQGSHRRIAYMPSLIRDSDDCLSLFRLAGSVYLAGLPCDISKVNRSENKKTTGKMVVDMPGYSWSYPTAYWTDARRSKQLLFRNHSRHELLGSRDPASTPVNMIWRNELELDDVPWIADHQIGNSILVPASAYVAMALEAASQAAQDIGVQPISFTVRDTKIQRPIILSRSNVVNTVLELSKQISTSHDEISFTFRVSSVTMEDVWTLHTSGTVQWSCNESMNQEKVQLPLSLQPRLNVYKELKAAGLAYGRYFQTLSRVEGSNNGFAKADIEMDPNQIGSVTNEKYFVHPTTMDGCFQLAFVAACSDFSTPIDRSYLPSEIVSIVVRRGSTADSPKVATVQGQVQTCGLRSITALFQLSQNNQIVLDGQVLFTAVKGLKDIQGNDNLPAPFSKLSWKLDVDALRDIAPLYQMDDLIDRGELSNSVHFDIALKPGTDHGHPTMLKQPTYCSALIKLVTFKNPMLNVLIWRALPKPFITSIIDSLQVDKRYKTFKSATILECRDESIELTSTIDAQTYAVKAIPINERQSLIEQGQDFRDAPLFVIAPRETLNQHLQSLAGTVTEGSYMLVVQMADENIHNRSSLESLLLKNNWELLVDYQSGLSVALAKFIGSATAPQPDRLRGSTLWVLRETMSESLLPFQVSAEKQGVQLRFLAPSEIDSLPENQHVLSLLELEQPFAANNVEAFLTCVRKLCKRKASITWVICGNKPEMALMPGLAKSLRLEVPGLSLNTLELKRQPTLSDASLIVKTAFRAGVSEENYFQLRDGKLYISRYIIDEQRNEFDAFRSRGLLKNGPLEGRLQLDMQALGDVNSIFFKETGAPPNAEELVLVSPTACSFSLHNAMELKGLMDGNSSSHEYFGKVVNAPEHAPFKVGDTVIAITNSTLSTEVSVPTWSCTSSTPEQMIRVLGLSGLCCRALYAISILARAQRGERIIVNTSDNQLLAVAKAVAGRIGAEIVSTNSGNDLSAKAKSIHIVVDFDGNLDYSMLEELLVPSPQLIRVTVGNSVKPWDTSSQCRAPGKSFVSVNFSQIQAECGDIFRELLSDSVKFLVDQQSFNSNIAWYEPGQIPKAVEVLLNSSTLDRIAISFSTDCLAPVHRVLQSPLEFSKDGWYLLVGCLGGLGRSITSWMYRNGARNFVFLSRSGDAKPEARVFVQELLSYPRVTVKVIEGDVCSRADVRRAVAACNSSLRGVVQAAVAFDEQRFSNMTATTWNNVVRPKLDGTYNLHHETLEEDLDFFVMTSSSIGIIGASTQTHYAAANAFLDAFATWRRSLGLPAVSLSIGMVTGVGHVSDDKSLEEVLRRRGSYGISEAEFLRMMEFACSPILSRDSESPVLISGLDPTRLVRIMESNNWTLSESVSSDNRLAHIQSASQGLRTTAENLQEKNVSNNIRLRDLLERDDSTDVRALVQAAILEKVSSLTLIPLKRLVASLRQSTSTLGMDSIIGTELQAWVWREYRVQLEFMQVIGGHETLESMVNHVVENLNLARSKEG